MEYEITIEQVNELDNTTLNDLEIELYYLLFEANKIKPQGFFQA